MSVNLVIGNIRIYNKKTSEAQTEEKIGKYEEKQMRAYPTGQVDIFF